MGMYVEFKINLELKSDLDQNVIDILKYMLNDGLEEPPKELPDHPFFKTNRWDMTLYSLKDEKTGEKIGLYKDPNTGNYIIKSCTELKDYEQEIEKFLNWIYPYSVSRGLVGTDHYEEYKNPSPIYFNDDGYTHEIDTEE